MPESHDDDIRDGDDKQEKETSTSARATRQGNPLTTGGRVPVLSVIALVVAIAALVLAGWTALSGSDSAEPGQASGTYSEEERAEAASALCAAFETVRQGVSMNTNAAPPGGPEDQAGAVAVMANARVALAAGGQYLSSRIDPAAPDELAREARELADLLSEIGARAIAGVSTGDRALASQMQEAEALSSSIADQCSEI